jgi:2-isopropylmalate synthase
VDAVYKAIGTATNNPARLVSYDIRSVTSGTEALGEATVQLQQGDTKVIGRGASTDVIEASARAYIDGLNKLSALRRRQESAQQQMFVDHAQP